MDTVTFVEAIKNKYADQGDFDDRITIPKNENFTTEITFVGFDKVSRTQRNLENLTNIDLSNNKISSSGDLSSLCKSLRRIEVLNISRNSFNSWSQVIDLISHMPALREIIVNANPIDWTAHRPNEISEYIRRNNLELPQIRQVSMGGIVMGNWEKTISALSSIWNNLQCLDLFDTCLDASKIRPPRTLICQNFISSLRSLILSGNTIASISELENLGQMTSLEELDISNCSLREIAIQGTLQSILGNLRRLNISFNCLNSWRSIAELNKLKSLDYLICHGNPLTSPSKTTKMMVIGRIGNLTCYNREEIPKAQRKDSELFYMRKIFGEYLNFKKGDNDTFMLENPRYEELLSLYGSPEDLSKVVVRNKYLNIHIHHSPSGKVILKKLPSDMPISNFKMLSKRLFNLGTNCRIKLSWVPTNNNMSCDLDKDGQGLSFYSIKDGDTIVVEEL